MSTQSSSVVTRMVDRVFPRMPDFYGLINAQCDQVCAAMDVFVEFMETGEQAAGERVRAMEKDGDDLKARNMGVLSRAFCNTDGSRGYLSCDCHHRRDPELRKDHGARGRGVGDSNRTTTWRTWRACCATAATRCVKAMPSLPPSPPPRIPTPPPRGRLSATPRRSTAPPSRNSSMPMSTSRRSATRPTRPRPTRCVM